MVLFGFARWVGNCLWFKWQASLWTVIRVTGHGEVIFWQVFPGQADKWHHGKRGWLLGDGVEGTERLGKWLTEVVIYHPGSKRFYRLTCPEQNKKTEHSNPCLGSLPCDWFGLGLSYSKDPPLKSQWLYERERGVGGGWGRTREGERGGKEGTIFILGFWFLLVKRLLKNQNHRHITEKQCLDAQLNR